MQVRRPKSDDVAARAGVSRTTVSFVLNDRPGASISPATRERVLAAAAELGYQPHASARGLAAGRTHTLGIVLRQSAEQVAEDALLAETLRGLSAAARAQRYRVLVEPYGPTHPAYGDLIWSRRTDGLVVSGPRSDDDELLGLADAGAPVVIQGSLPSADVPSVDVDNVAAARRAVEHLIGLGHTAIGCITNAPLTYTAAVDRVAGYREALSAAGIEYDPSRVAEASFDAASGRRQMSALLAGANITAVFVASDVVAFGAISAIREAGLRVPDDVSVVGFDDIPLAAFFDPPLTTVRLPAFELGRAAGAALIDRIHGRDVSPRTVLPTELVIRSSTAPPRGHRGRSRDRPATEPVTMQRRRRGGESIASKPSRKETQRMNRSNARSRPVALMAAAMLVAVACTSPATSTAPQPTGGGGASPGASTGGGQIGGQVSVWTAWGGGELTDFQKVLKPFMDQTGITVITTTVRDQDLQLSNNKSAGTPQPDIANPPNPQRYSEWAGDGTMKAAEDYLGDNLQAYLANTVPALTADNPANGVVGGKHYLMFVRTQVKGLIWYNPKVFTATAPATWDDMLAVQPPSGTKLFCAAFESGDASGWPASDDIANIVMRQAGEQVYVDWYSGKHKWTSPEIKQAYQTFGQMVANDKLYGGTNYALSTNFGKAGDGLFSNPPGCLFMEQATFIPSFFEQNDPTLKGQAGTGYNFFPHPSINDQYSGNVEGFADSFVMYNDTPQARALMQYMMSDQAQQIWVDQGDAMAASKNITKYPNVIFENAAKIVSSAKNILLTAGDQMPADMQHAFWQSLLDYTADPSKLDSILAHLDEVQATAYTQ